MARSLASAEVSTWVASAGPSTDGFRDEVVAALREQGLAAEKDSSGARGTGVVAFDEVSPGLCRLE